MSERPDELSPLKRSLVAIERLTQRVHELEGRASEPLAVIGMGCRFPGGADDPEAYFTLLLDGVDAVRAAPPVPRPTWPGSERTIDIPPAAYLDIDLGAFDAPFFGISPREAAGMDPQQRLTLECAFEALEDAGIDPQGLTGSATGVFIGITGNEYAHVQMASERASSLLDSHFTSGIAHSMVSGRLSYLWGLQGPSLSIDTACSSSLVALHLGCQSLRNGESDLVLVGGVNVILTPDYARAYQRSRMLAPDGRCKTFDASADGFGRGEGCAIVVLKRLSDALRDGDVVRAIVRGTAVNQDGPSSGLTAPNGPAQEAVIEAALAQAGLGAGDVHYVEAHGTGTELGDPIEVLALGSAYGRGRSAGSPLLVGSVKTNFGHLEAASGIAGFMKTVLCVERGMVPPHLHFRSPSPHIPWARLPLKVVTERTRLAPQHGPARAAVSSFGFSGTNAHVIVEAPPEGTVGVRTAAQASPDARRSAPPPPRREHLLMISAADPEALRALSRGWSASLTRITEGALADHCHTSTVVRGKLSHRLAVVAPNGPRAAEELEGWLRGEPSPRVRHARRAPDDPRLLFLFTGQGSQREGMGAGLARDLPAFSAALAECAALFDEHLEAPLLDVLHGEHRALVHRTDYTQPAIFALQHALATQWEVWGIVPDVVVGHSIGEYGAARLAGVLSLDDAVSLVAHRGRLMQAVQDAGRMIAVFVDEDGAREILEGLERSVSIAALNAPGEVVLSGAIEGITEAESRARARGLTVKPLKTSQAFHSPLMDSVVDGMRAALGGVELRAPTGPRFVSSVTGEVADARTLRDPEYWAGQVRAPVRFAQAARVAARMADHALEIGPRPTLAGLIAAADLPLSTTASMRPEGDELVEMLAAAGELWTRGLPLDGRAVEPGNYTRIPRYPFQRTRLWVDLGSGGPREQDAGVHPILGRRIPQPGSDRVFQRRLRADAPAFIGEHRVLGRPILPGTAYLSAALAAARQVFGTARIEDVDLLEPMLFDDGARLVHTRLAPSDDGGWTFEISSTGDPESEQARWTTHARGGIVAAASPLPTVDLTAALERCPEEHAHADLYTGLAERGYDFGPRLRGVRRARSGTDEAIGWVELPEACAEDPERYDVHPLLLDAALQVAGRAFGARAGEGAYLPVAVSSVHTVERVPDSVVAHVRAHSGSGDGATLRADATLLDADGRTVGVLEGVVFRRAAALGAAPARGLLELRWVEEASEAMLPAPDELWTRAAGMLRAGAEQEGAAAYDEFVRGLEERSFAYVRRALSELGWIPRAGETVEAGALAERLGVAPLKRRLFERCLEILAEEGVLERIASGWRVLAPLDGASQDAAPAGGGAPEVVLLERCGPHLAHNLRGLGDPLELLFGESAASDDAERMYHDAPLARVFGRTVADLIAHAAEAARPERPLRVLEVGGGTGGATGHVVERLLGTDGRAGSSVPVRYHFTDVSPHFVERARRRFGSWSGMSFGTYDLDRPPEEQGIEPGSFDVVVAASCIHAARALEGALAGLGRVLREDGVLVAVEVFGPHRWFDLTVGLTDGWWHYVDPELRGGYPCPKPEVWTNVLVRAGFTDARAVPLAEAVGSAGGVASSRQGLVLARRTAGAVSAEAATSRDDAWLLLSDDAALGREIAHGLERRGAASSVASPGEWREAIATRGRWRGVAHVHAARRADAADPLDAVVRHLDVARTCAEAGSDVGELLLVTRGAQAATRHDADVSPASAALWGLSRTIGLESGDLAPRRLDLDATPDGGEAERIAAWILETSGEPETAHRRGKALRARLGRHTRSDEGHLPAGYRLTIGTRGSLDGLRFVGGEPVAPGPGEVRVRVAATSLNFKDVLNVLDLYPGDPGPLGGECAGVVTAIGDGVQHIRVGDAVVAVTGGAFAEQVVADARMVARLPQGRTFAEAASLPIAYLTAHIALVHLARLGPGDRVLIHAATGGVGTAARAIASRVGAEVFATAGTPEKRAMLRAQGVRHVFDSRSDEFVEGILEATGGDGVTVVLNSLADRLVDETFRVVARGARFLEIGKRGIWTPERVAALGRDIAYHVIDWGETYRADPEAVALLFREVMGQIDEGGLPTLPSARFDLEEVESAFRFMAAGRHTGKIVVLHPVLDCPLALPIVADGSYLITGGLSGLGLATARWLAERGATSLVLLGRAGPDGETEAAIGELRGHGVAVAVVSADVSDAGSLEAGLRSVPDASLPIRGVIHSAGALRDRSMTAMSRDDFESVFAAKVRGSQNLIEALEGEPLDFFLGYSSIAGVFGSPGQANHAAANAYLDALAATLWGRTRGSSIAWGPWSETGSATDAQVLARAEALGVGALTNAEGLVLLAEAFAGPGPQLVGMRVDRPERLSGQRRIRLSEGFSGLGEQQSRPEAPPSAAGGALVRLLAGQPIGSHRSLVAEFVRGQVESVLGLPVTTSVEDERPLGEMGLDSLLAVELRNLLGKAAGRKLPTTLLFDHPTVDALTAFLLAELQGSAEDEAPEEARDTLGSLESLSDDEVDRLLAAKLRSHD